MQPTLSKNNIEDGNLLNNCTLTDISKSQTQSRTSRTLTKFEYIDVLRGLAISLVIAVHTAQQFKYLPYILQYIFNYGQLGVQLFFVASALTLCISSKQRNENTPFNFYIRRFFRIAPAYYFAIVFYFFWRLAGRWFNGGDLSIPSGYSIHGLLENILFIHGFDPRNYNYIVPGGWSIATEMSFYAIFPLLYLFQKNLGANRFVILAVIAIAVSFAVEMFLIFFIEPFLINKNIIKNQFLNDGFGFIYASFINQIGVFLIGMIAFQNLNRTQLTNSKIILFVILNVLSCFLLNTKIFNTGMNGFIYPLLSAAAFSILAVCMANSKYRLTSFFARTLIKFGRVSFSMYLIHFAIIDAVSFILNAFLPIKDESFAVFGLLILYSFVIFLTYSIAKMTFKYIEKPGINLGNAIISRRC